MMGNLADPNVVLDSHLWVRGVAGLRVVDASVMTTICYLSLESTAGYPPAGQRVACFDAGRRWIPLKRRAPQV
jgi:hypothetical protein